MATQTEVKQFIEKMSKLVIAERIKRDKWVLPSICIAQSALETGWGKSNLMTKANAYFGIKASKSWCGRVYSSKTQECYDGVNYTTITALFRAYDSIADSISDYFDLITGLSRYANAVNNNDALSTITAIKNGGYATSPTYIDNIMSIVNKYNLTQYDNVECTEQLKPLDEIAQEVYRGLWGNGEVRKQKLTESGYNYEEVQKLVTKLVVGCVNKEATSEGMVDKSIEQVAKEVIDGKWGNGVTRKEKLTKCGYDYDEVQSCVNSLLKSNTVKRLTNEQVAKEVINGKWGNGNERKRKLTESGYDYNEIQKIVNKLLK